MMVHFSSYLICGTPRSGSTLLCDLLAATGVAGRPNSYFRQPDILAWANAWGVDTSNGIEHAEFDKAYLAAMLGEGMAGTGIFGLRLMWGSVAEAQKRLNRVYGGTADVAERIEQAFKSTLYIHLSRQDKLAQAVSLLRAEQSGLWHVAADGSERERTAPSALIAYDSDRIAALVSELKGDDAAWVTFFTAHRIVPLSLTYETLSADPRTALVRVLSALGCDPKVAEAAHVRTAKMADAISLEWVDRFRREHGFMAN